ncbi:MAG: flagellar assembly protein FliW [Spirochaetales bacterium]|nr:flagellar assembly protein FliW [Spirochaetales bacterium]
MVRRIHTKAYGDVEIREQQIVQFPRGIFGFDHIHEYALLDSATPPFYWLQSTAEAKLAFVLINPYIVAEDYVLDIATEDLDAIGSPAPDDLLVFAIVTIPQERRNMSCNLQGPLIINRRTRIAGQAISLDQRWKIKHYLFAGEGE